MSGVVNLTKEQNNVIEAKNNDILVAASAGSGKTFVVAHRIINRVINDNIDIDKILVVTFTNAAALELKSRILSGFYDALKDKKLPADKRLHLERQLTLINRAQISTIHSFCLSIIRNHFYLLNIDSNVKTVDENKAKIMLLESIDEIIDEEYEKKTEIFSSILEMFKTEESIIENLEKIYNFSMSMAYPEKWLEESLEKYNQHEYEKDLSNLDFGEKIMHSVQEKLILIVLELEKVCNKIRGDKEFESRLNVLENMLEKIQDIQKISSFDELYDYIYNRLDFPNLPSSKCSNEELKKEVLDIKKKVTAEIKNISKYVYKNTKGIKEELNQMYPIVNWYISAVRKLANIYSQKKTSLGYIDFADYEHLALKVLENENICKEYINKYDEIYIDEYQDTSYIQELILKYISKNNRIMVGDVKQSIYSFRNAEPTLFNEKYNEYKIYDEAQNEEKPSKIILAKNFRSRKIVLDSINDVFSRVMSEDVGECEYGEKEYLTYGEGFSAETENDCITEINIVETESEDEYVAEDEVENEIEEIGNIEKEAIVISEKINELISSGFKLYDNKKKEYRNIDYKDIVILLRSVNNKANIYEDILKENNIPAFSDTSDSFYNGQEVSIILSFLKIIDNIYDDISLVSTLYSIIGKFTVDDLVYIRNYDKKGYFYEALQKTYLDDINREKPIYRKIERFLNLVNRITAYKNTYTLAETILKIYEDTGIYYSFYLEEMGKQRCANLDSLVDMARAFEKEERSSIYNFIQYIENIKGRKTKGNDTPKLLGEGENVVRILTIHKSKGLEYPVVFLADASKKYNTLDIASEILLDKEYGIGLDTFNVDLGISYSNIIKQAIKEKIKEKTLSEEQRLLYVAMTRAKEKLFIYGTVKNYNKYINKLSMVTSNEKISPVLVKDCNNYLKLIMMATASGKSKNIAINVISASKKMELLPVVGNKKIDRSVSCKEKFLSICKDKKVEVKDIDTSFANEYDYKENLNIKKKYTVTEIKKKANNEEENIQSLITDETFINGLEEIKPKCISTEISNVGYGTIIHKILENIDYTNICIDEIEKIVYDICNECKEINIKKVTNYILSYLSGQIIDIVKDAKAIFKEQPFVIYDDLATIPSLELNEKTYIQGVIDLYVITKENKHIIIDFKTDKVETEEQLIDKYKYQLLVYKRGIELSNNENIKVDDMYIYSFSLNKLIKI